MAKKIIEPNPFTMGYRLYIFLKDSNISEGELAEICKTSASTISRLKDNALKSANLNVIRRICNYFNTSLDYLVGTKEE